MGRRLGLDANTVVYPIHFTTQKLPLRLLLRRQLHAPVRLGAGDRSALIAVAATGTELFLAEVRPFPLVQGPLNATCSVSCAGACGASDLLCTVSVSGGKFPILSEGFCHRELADALLRGS